MARVSDNETQIAFSDLVVQMMDLRVGQRVATPADIAHNLNAKGWNVAQVSSVWNVSPTVAYEPHWNELALDSLGGKGLASRVWLELKSNSLTGFPKRAADDIAAVESKKLKLDSSKKVGKDSFEIAPPATPLVGQLQANSVNMLARNQSNNTCIDTPSPGPRQKYVRPKRKLALNEKITWWFTRSDGPKTPSSGTPQPP